MLFSAGLTAALGRGTHGDFLSKLPSASISVIRRDVRVDDMERDVLEGNQVSFQKTQKEFFPLGDRDHQCAFGRMTVAI